MSELVDEDYGVRGFGKDWWVDERSAVLGFRGGYFGGEGVNRWNAIQSTSAAIDTSRSLRPPLL